MAISFTPEQFERFLTEMLSRATPVSRRGEGGEGHQRRILTDKGFNRVGKFSHGEGSWGEWSFDFKTALGAQSVELKAYLQGIERQTEVINYARAVAMDEERAEKVNLEKLSAELYEMLVMMTEGEAKLIVKACIAGDGLEAWSRLQKHYSKRTVARLLRLHREVMYPKQAELGQLVTAIMEWEDKWRRMEVEMNVKDKIPVEDGRILGAVSVGGPELDLPEPERDWRGLRCPDAEGGVVRVQQGGVQLEPGTSADGCRRSSTRSSRRRRAPGHRCG
jgi:hypothetical protein